jgi:hypothetical protein
MGIFAPSERHASLKEIPAVGAQHRDFARVETRAEQETIEPVVFDFTAPRGGKGILEVCLQAGVLDVETLAVLELEVLDPRSAALGPHELVGTLGDDPEAEVLQHGQQVGDRHRVAELHDLEMDSFGFRQRRAVQLQAHRLRMLAKRFQVGEVL